MPRMKFHVTTRPHRNFTDTESKAPRPQMERHQLPIGYLPPWRAESLTGINTGLCRCVSVVFMCVWGWFVLSFSCFMSWQWKNGEINQEKIFTQQESSFYSKLARVTEANCNALSFQEAKAFVIPTNALFYRSAGRLLTTVTHKSPFYRVNN